MNYGDVLVMGGTSDARMLCQQLDAANVAYTLSVATPTGKAAGGRHQRPVRCGRLEREQMIARLQENQTRWVIDASHPYARGGESQHHECLRSGGRTAEPLPAP